MIGWYFGRGLVRQVARQLDGRSCEQGEEDEGEARRRRMAGARGRRRSSGRREQRPCREESQHEQKREFGSPACADAG
eukprot:1928371-Pleurochrysis_carterae.AAC.1